MSTILAYLREYASAVDRGLLFFCIVWTGVLITLNYQLSIEKELIAGLDSRLDQWLALFLVYCSAFIIPYLFAMVVRKQWMTFTPMFWLLLFIAPALFALKVSIANPLENSMDGVWGSYLTIITTLPFKCLVVLVPLVILYKILPAQSSFWGMTLRDVRWQPYCLMLALMVPLIIFASTQADFLNAYPRLKQVAFIEPYTGNLLWYQLLYEISYGIDFITVELFFRGFLVFAFIRYAGPAALLPMATFYCSIHFGKPLFECISSFFGGLILGIIAHRTQSIVGGLAMHLGIAWMMEIGGYAGNLWMK
ncbi:MAG: CPBP family intramembrane glutamic endopeptidase [Pseudomonadota bacterium]